MRTDRKAEAVDAALSRVVSSKQQDDRTRLLSLPEHPCGVSPVSAGILLNPSFHEASRWCPHGLAPSRVNFVVTAESPVVKFVGRAAALTLIANAIALAACGGSGGGDGGGNGGSGGAQTPPSPTVTLTATPSKISAGGSTTLEWSSRNATSCSASDGWSGDRATSGTEAVSGLAGTTMFTLSCTNGSQTAIAQAIVQVDEVSSPPPTIEFSANPSLVQRGGWVTLTWSSTNTTYCYPSWFYSPNLPTSGSATVQIDIPTERFVATLQCGGNGREISKTVVVDVQTLAGDLLVPSGIFADGDVNDPSAEYAPNDTPLYGTPIPSFCAVPGYVNLPLSGPPGRSFESGDVHDYFRASNVSAGQIVRLLLPTVDPNAPVATSDDADLYLWDIDGNLIDAAIGSGASEVLTIPRYDQYVIEVRATRGGFNYLMLLEDPDSATTASADRLSADFVSGEAIVSFEPDTHDGGKNIGKSKFEESSRAAVSNREVRMTFAEEVMARRKLQINAPEEKPFGPRELTEETSAKLATLLELKELRSRPDVRFATLNRIMHADAVVPSDPQYAAQRWHYESIKLPSAWEISTGSPDVMVAVIDSGVLTDHPDLQGKLVDGYDFVSTIGLDGDGLDGDPSDPGFSVGSHWIFHGTHVAGTVGANTNNDTGGAGVAWGVRLMPLRVLDGRSGTEYDVLQAVRYAAGLPNDSMRMPARRADVINLSLGTSGECSAAGIEVFDAVSAAGVAIVAAAGNDSSNAPADPASCPGVISVGAIGSSGSLAFYSNYGQYVTLVAPGGDMGYDLDGDGTPDGVLSASGVRQNGVTVPAYDVLQGTSMAAPHVSGVLALMKSLQPSLTPSQIAYLLEAGSLTDDVDLYGRDAYGFGVLNAARAVQAALSEIPNEPRVAFTPTYLSFGNIETSLRFEIRSAGAAPLAVSDVRSTVAWANVTPFDVNTSGLGRYEVTVSRSGLPRGNHAGAIEVTSSAGTTSLFLSMTHLDYNVAPRLGTVHVRAISGAAGESLRELAIERLSARTPYRFDDVPLGSVVILAGTDLNNDGNLCDPGEVCGAYPTVTLPDAIDYSGVRTDVDIILDFTALKPVRAD